MLDPRLAYSLGHLIRPLVPALSGSDLHNVLRDFAQHIQVLHTRGKSPQTWQEAWNDFIGPRQQVTYTPARCPNCNGRGFTHRQAARNISRTGNPMVCGECMGNTRRSRSRQTKSARHAPLPDPTNETPNAT